MFDNVDECPINDDYKQREYDQMDLFEQLHFNHQNRISAEATEEALRQWAETGSVDDAKNTYFNHLNLYL